MSETEEEAGYTIDLRSIAEEMLACALKWDPDARPLGNIKAVEIVALAGSKLLLCPKCGAEAWVNTDCDLCELIGKLLGKD